MERNLENFTDSERKAFIACAVALGLNPDTMSDGEALEILMQLDEKEAYSGRAIVVTRFRFVARILCMILRRLDYERAGKGWIFLKVP